jgi:hypothetical protein
MLVRRVVTSPPLWLVKPSSAWLFRPKRIRGRVPVLRPCARVQDALKTAPLRPPVRLIGGRTAAWPVIQEPLERFLPRWVPPSRGQEAGMHDGRE